MQYSKARKAAIAMIAINKKYELLCEDFHGCLVYYDNETGEVAIATTTEINRPVTYSGEGRMSRKEFEDIVDLWTQEEHGMSSFIRHDVFHVFFQSDTSRALIRQHVNVVPYE